MAKKGGILRSIGAELASGAIATGIGVPAAQPVVKAAIKGPSGPEQ